MSLVFFWIFRRMAGRQGVWGWRRARAVGSAGGGVVGGVRMTTARCQQVLTAGYGYRQVNQAFVAAVLPEQGQAYGQAGHFAQGQGDLGAAGVAGYGG